MATNRCVSPRAIANEKLAKYLYKKSIIGHIRTLYSNAKRRVKGKGTSNPHLYIGLPICSFKDFESFCLNNKNFYILYSNWQSNNYDRKLTPSINRINTKKGYILGNMEIITSSKNSSLSLGNTNRDKKGRYAIA